MDKAVEELQQELKVLKNEIKETLTDVREVLLNTVENPFPQDLSSRPMASSPAPQAAPRPNQGFQQDSPQQAPIVPQQGGMGMGMGPGVGGGGTVLLGNMGGGGAGYPSMPQYMPSSAPAHEAAYQPAAPAHAAEQVIHEQPQAPPAPIHGGGPSLPPAGARRDRPSDGGGRSAEGPGLPPRGRESGDRRPAREEEREGRDVRPSPTRKGPTPARLGGQRRPLGAPPIREEEVYDVDDEYYEEPSEFSDEGGFQEHRPSGKVDLVVLASLSPWLSNGIKRIGRKRIKAVLDIYASMGGMSRDLRDVLAQIVDMDDTEGSQDQVSVQDSMRLLIELDELMWRGRQDWRRAALMTMLSADESFRP